MFEGVIPSPVLIYTSSFICCHTDIAVVAYPIFAADITLTTLHCLIESDSTSSANQKCTLRYNGKMENKINKDFKIKLESD